MRHFDLNDSQVGFAVAPDDLGGIADRGRLTHQADADTVGFVHHVEVGDNVAAGADNHAGAERLRGHISAARRSAVTTLWSLAEETVEPILHSTIAALVAGTGLRGNAHAAMWVLDGGFGVDVDHGGFDRLGHAGKFIVVLARGRHAQAGRIAAVHRVGASGVGEHRADDQHQRDCHGGDEKRGEIILPAARVRGLKTIVRQSASILQRFHVSSGKVIIANLSYPFGKRGVQRPGRNSPPGHTC